MSGGVGRIGELLDSIGRALKTEIGQLHPWQDGLTLVSRLIPHQAGNSLRAELLRRMGFEIGPHTELEGTPKLNGPDRQNSENLRIGSHCQIGVDCEFEPGATITIGDHVTLGHEVMILTTTHELGSHEHRAGAIVRNPVTIESGAWIGARSIILPGVTIGEGAIVEACSVVTQNVANNARVAGNPARQLELVTP